MATVKKEIFCTAYHTFGDPKYHEQHICTGIVVFSPEFGKIICPYGCSENDIISAIKEKFHLAAEILIDWIG